MTSSYGVPPVSQSGSEDADYELSLAQRSLFDSIKEILRAPSSSISPSEYSSSSSRSIRREFIDPFSDDTTYNSDDDHNPTRRANHDSTMSASTQSQNEHEFLIWLTKYHKHMKRDFRLACELVQKISEDVESTAPDEVISLTPVLADLREFVKPLWEWTREIKGVAWYYGVQTRKPEIKNEFLVEERKRRDFAKEMISYEREKAKLWLAREKKKEARLREKWIAESKAVEGSSEKKVQLERSKLIDVIERLQAENLAMKRERQLEANDGRFSVIKKKLGMGKKT